MQDIREFCAVEAATAVIGGKWKCLILYRLIDGPIRFNALLRTIPGVTRRMLTLQLRELEHHGLVHREVYQQVPPKVEYSLTPLGKSFEQNLQQLRQWGEKYLKAQGKHVAQCKERSS